MVPFDLSFRSMLIKEIVEDEGALRTEGSISWISINIGSYRGKSIHVVDGAFHTCVGVSPGAVHLRAGYRSVSSVWFPFCVF